MISLFYHTYVYIEVTPTEYLATFAFKFLHWPVNDVSLLMTLFFGTHFLGRFLGIPLSFVLRPRTMVIINLIVTMIAYVILLPVKGLPVLLWVSAALAGIGMATTYVTTLLWISESITISVRVSAIVTASGSFGSIVQPQVIGRLFDVPAVGGPMSMVYVLVTAALTHVALFNSMLMFVAQCFNNKRLRFVQRRPLYKSVDTACILEKIGGEQKSFICSRKLWVKKD